MSEWMHGATMSHKRTERAEYNLTQRYPGALWDVEISPSRAKHPSFTDRIEAVLYCDRIEATAARTQDLGLVP